MSRIAHDHKRGYVHPRLRHAFEPVSVFVYIPEHPTDAYTRWIDSAWLDFPNRGATSKVDARQREVGFVNPSSCKYFTTFFITALLADRTERCDKGVYDDRRRAAGPRRPVSCRRTCAYHKSELCMYNAKKVSRSFTKHK